MLFHRGERVLGDEVNEGRDHEGGHGKGDGEVGLHGTALGGAESLAGGADFLGEAVDHIGPDERLAHSRQLPQ